MARRLTRREWSLIGFVALLGLAALWIRDPEFRLGGRPAEKVDEALDLGDAPVIQLAKLEPVPEDYDRRGRNLFQYYTPPPPPRRQTKQPPKVRVRKPPPPPPPPAVTPPRSTTPPKPQPPRISFAYLGYLGPKNNRIAVFEDGDDIFLARAGEVVRDKFRVVDFGYEKLIMGYTEERFKDQTTELDQKKSKKRR
jgi:hypothetical protein